jgi:hypothetical protein
MEELKGEKKGMRRLLAFPSSMPSIDLFLSSVPHSPLSRCVIPSTCPQLSCRESASHEFLHKRGEDAEL